MKGSIFKLPLIAITSAILSFSALAVDDGSAIKSRLDGSVTIGEQVSKTEIQRASSSPVAGTFTFSYPWWINISGSCQKLIFLVTSGHGYNQMYHTPVEAWGTSSGITPYTNRKTWVTHAVIGSVSCDSYAPGIEF